MGAMAQVDPFSLFGGSSFGGDIFSDFAAPSFGGLPVGPSAPTEAPAPVVVPSDSSDSNPSADGNDFDATDEDDGRYIVITTSPITSPTTAPIAGDRCWHCDSASFADCAAEGEYRTCHLGDNDCCFLEIRENND